MKIKVILSRGVNRLISARLTAEGKDMLAKRRLADIKEAQEAIEWELRNAAPGRSVEIEWEGP